MQNINDPRQSISILETPQLMGSLEKVTYWIKNYLLGEQWKFDWQAVAGDSPTIMIRGEIEFSPSKDISEYSSTIDFLIRNKAPQKGSSNHNVEICIQEYGRGIKVITRYPYLLSGFIGGMINALMIKFPKVESLSQRDEKSQIVGGRPHDKGYDRAYEIIKSGGTYSQAFTQFCEENGIRKPDKTTRDGFKSAMKRRGYTPNIIKDI